MAAGYPIWPEEGISDHWKSPLCLALYWALGDVTANQWELLRLQSPNLGKDVTEKET